MTDQTAPANIVELWERATWRDYAFVVLTFLLLCYMSFNVFSVIRVPDSRFDYMFISGAGAFIWGAWRLDRIGDRLPRVLKLLDQAGSIIITEADRERIERDIALRGHLYGLAGIILISILMLVVSCIQYLHDGDLGMAVALALSLTVSGGYAGYRFGQLVANGQLLGFLSKAGYEIKAGGNLGSKALVPLRDLYGIAVLTGICLCGFLNIWWLAWTLKLPFALNFCEWKSRFLVLWFVCMAIFILIGLVPVRRFNKRLDAIYGGADARQNAARQRDLARVDLERLDNRIRTLRQELDATESYTNRQTFLDLNKQHDELAAYAQGLVDQTHGDGLMRVSTVIGFALASAIVMGACVFASGIN